jgi:hypothetical protein
VYRGKDNGEPENLMLCCTGTLSLASSCCDTAASCCSTVRQPRACSLHCCLSSGSASVRVISLCIMWKALVWSSTLATARCSIVASRWLAQPSSRLPSIQQTARCDAHRQHERLHTRDIASRNVAAAH